LPPTVSLIHALLTSFAPGMRRINTPTNFSSDELFTTAIESEPHYGTPYTLHTNDSLNAFTYALVLTRVKKYSPSALFLMLSLFLKNAKNLQMYD
jgi:hypothetical protein